MILLFYGVKRFHVYFKVNYSGCIGSGQLAQTTTTTLKVTALAGLACNC
jgi:hypothetical protein